MSNQIRDDSIGKLETLIAQLDVQKTQAAATLQAIKDSIKLQQAVEGIVQLRTALEMLFSAFPVSLRPDYADEVAAAEGALADTEHYEGAKKGGD